MVAGSGLPIGVSQDFTYSELCLKLRPGDRLCLYSDGITEAKNAQRDLFGDEQFMKILSETRPAPLTESLDTVVRQVNAWCRPSDPDDDVTLLACELTRH